MAPDNPTGVTTAADYLSTLSETDAVLAVSGLLERRPGMRRAMCSAVLRQQGTAPGLAALVAAGRTGRRSRQHVGTVSAPLHITASAGYSDGELGVFRKVLKPGRQKGRRDRSPTPPRQEQEQARSLALIPHGHSPLRWAVTPRPPPPHRPQDGPVLDSTPLLATKVDTSPSVLRLARPCHPRHKALDRVTFRDAGSGTEYVFTPGVGCLRFHAGGSGRSAGVQVLRLWFRAARTQQDADAAGDGLNDGDPAGPVLLLPSRTPPDLAEHGADLGCPRLQLPRDENELEMLVSRLRTLADTVRVRHNLPSPRPQAPEQTSRVRARTKQEDVESNVRVLHSRPLSGEAQEQLIRRLHDNTLARAKALSDALHKRYVIGSAEQGAAPLDSDGVDQANARLYYDEVSRRNELLARQHVQLSAPLAKTVERYEQDIEVATERLYEEARQAAKMKRDDLNRKYLPRPPRKRFETQEQAEDSLKHLYETAEQRAERRQKLWEVHVGQHQPKHKKLTPAEVSQTVQRLTAK
eukprot:TRINITY_DN43300_c0_g1_i1.p1 TRINITY_DN43300_c0_g1~~TRINITY_DN43300_c0_g1_i1.p1  ORF type:complete len:523 (+),score=191.96 TRINITY_DN43300_c0_g1_i1:64-1632(+)